MICPKCKTDNFDWVNVCKKCGHLLKEPDMPHKPASSEQKEWIPYSQRRRNQSKLINIDMPVKSKMRIAGILFLLFFSWITFRTPLSSLNAFKIKHLKTKGVICAYRLCTKEATDFRTYKGGGEYKSFDFCDKHVYQAPRKIGAGLQGGMWIIHVASILLNLFFPFAIAFNLIFTQKSTEPLDLVCNIKDINKGYSDAEFMKLFAFFSATLLIAWLSTAITI